MGQNSGSRTWLRKACLAFVLTRFLSGGFAQSQDLDTLAKSSLEDLMNVRVTSVTKKEQSLSQSAAAAYVISREDIRRSGMTNVPDLLRMAPGVNVARINSNTWAISIRGFNYRYANKVLVLIDGRSVYTPTFSGIFWDQQSVPLEDIERIEIIRGPGGTVWGANAVNGVINIITTSAAHSQGTLISVGSGSTERAQAYVRQGGRFGQNGAYRVFGRYFNVLDSVNPSGSPAVDGWHGQQVGFRSDWDLSPADTLTVHGDLYATGEHQTISAILPSDQFRLHSVTNQVKVGSGNVLGRYQHSFANGSRASVQAYYSRFKRFDMAHMDERNADVEFQYQFAVGSRHGLMAGAGIRSTSVAYEGIYNIYMDPSRFRAGLYSTFVQDEIRLTKTVTLTAGSKFEHNAFSGFEFEPSAQILWAPNRRHSFWTSVARAVRQPSALEWNSRVDGSSSPLGDTGMSAVFRIYGNSQMQAPIMLDSEAGYRAQLSKRLSVDVTGFRSSYRRSVTVEPETPFFTADPAPRHLVVPARWANKGAARSYGAEIFANWQATSRWRITPSFSYLHLKLLRESSTGYDLERDLIGSSPRHQGQLRSAVSLTRNVEWDAAAYFVSRLETGSIPAYVRLDSHLSWRVGEITELSATGQNLLSPSRLEIDNALQTHATLVQRSIFGKVTWRF